MPKLLNAESAQHYPQKEGAEEVCWWVSSMSKGVVINSN